MIHTLFFVLKFYNKFYRVISTNQTLQVQKSDFLFFILCISISVYIDKKISRGLISMILHDYVLWGLDIYKFVYEKIKHS